MIAIHLNKLNYAPVCVTGYEEAMEQASACDLVIADYLLGSSKTGIDLIEDILQSNRFYPALMLTAFGTRQFVSEWAQSGGIEFIDKPLHSVSELELKIRLTLHTSLNKYLLQMQKEKESERVSIESFLTKVSDPVETLRGSVSLLADRAIQKKMLEQIEAIKSELSLLEMPDRGENAVKRGETPDPRRKGIIRMTGENFQTRPVDSDSGKKDERYPGSQRRASQL